MPGNFFDLPTDQTCTHPEHFPPTHLYIPPGKGYIHTCPACGRTQTVVPRQLTMRNDTYWPLLTCWCESCDIHANGFRSHMSVCPDCGNKRCPKATHHDNACTNSNAPGQPGSSWEHVKPHGATND